MTGPGWGETLPGSGGGGCCGCANLPFLPVGCQGAVGVFTSGPPVVFVICLSELEQFSREGSCLLSLWYFRHGKLVFRVAYVVGGNDFLLNV